MLDVNVSSPVSTILPRATIAMMSPSLVSLSTVHFSEALRARERSWALAPRLLSVVKLCFFMPVWERGKAGASTVLSRILLRREFLQVVREMCAASWRDRLFFERRALGGFLPVDCAA